MIDYNTVSQSMLIVQQNEVTREMCSNISDNKLLNEAVYQCCKAIKDGYEFCNLGQIHGMLLGIKCNQEEEKNEELVERCRDVVRMHSINGCAYSFRRSN